MRVLILGGTTEASALARAIAADARFAATLSLAGRTQAPAAQPIPVRSGGFGGADGLAAHLRAERVDVLVDATHPFAQRISRNAVQAAAEARTPLLAILRPPWRPEPGDRWLDVDSMEAAAEALGPAPRRVLLTIGQQDLAPFAARPQHRYVIRSVEPPIAPPADSVIVTARGPFEEAAERALLHAHGIELLVSKNSGGGATAAKLAAARALGVPVVMVRRPPRPASVETVATAAAALGLLARHAALRGE